LKRSPRTIMAQMDAAGIIGIIGAVDPFNPGATWDIIA
jgi:hypothetical protein